MQPSCKSYPSVISIAVSIIIVFLTIVFTFPSPRGVSVRDELGLQLSTIQCVLR